MTEKLPPLPRKRKDRGLTVGPGVFWWKLWKEYHDEGGSMGYESWFDAYRRLLKEKNREDRWRKK